MGIRLKTAIFYIVTFGLLSGCDSASEKVSSINTQGSTLGIKTGNGIQSRLLLNGVPVVAQPDAIEALGSDEVSCVEGVEDVNYLGRPPYQVSIVLLDLISQPGVVEVKASYPNQPTPLSFFMSPGDPVNIGCEYRYRNENGVEILSLINDISEFYVRP